MTPSRHRPVPPGLTGTREDLEDLSVLLGFDVTPPESPGDSGGGGSGGDVPGHGAPISAVPGAASFPPGRVRPGGGTASAARLAHGARRIMAARETPPSTRDTEALVAGLLQRLEGPGARPSADPAPREGHRSYAAHSLGLLQILAPQIRLLSWSFWLATALVLAGGMVITGWLGQGARSSALFLMMGTPLLTALGIAAAFRSRTNPMGELEATFAVTPEQVVWGRTVLVVGYDTALALGASFILSAAAPGELSLVGLISSWLVPMLLLGAVALIASMGSSPGFGTALSTGLWSAVLLAHEQGWLTWFREIAGGPGGAGTAAPFHLVSRAGLIIAAGAAFAVCVRYAMAANRSRWLEEVRRP